MNSASFDAARLIGNLVAIVVVALAGALAFDYVAGLLGFRPGLLCGALRPVEVLAQIVAIGLGTIGAIIFVVSKFSRAELLLGALVIGVLPGVLLHYLGASCAS